jgi:hypothetical protein
VKRSLSLLAFALVATLAGSAEADSRGIKDVILKDGTRVTGRLEEVVPGERCVVRSVDGTRRSVVTWSAIKRIAEPGTPDDTPPPPAPPPKEEKKPPLEPDPPDKPDTSRKVLVEIVAAEPVRLEMSVAGGTWEVACTSPCGVELPVDAAYRITHEGKQIRGFRLEPNGADKITIDVSLGNGAIRGAGIVGLVLGTVVGYVALGAASDAGRRRDDNAGLVALSLLGWAVATVGGIGAATSGAGITQSTGFRQETPPKKDTLPRARGLSGTLFTMHF